MKCLLAHLQPQASGLGETKIMEDKVTPATVDASKETCHTKKISTVELSSSASTTAPKKEAQKLDDNRVIVY